MAHGPMEIVVFALPGAGLAGEMLAEIEALVGAGTVRIVDAVLARRDAEGVLTVSELADDPTWDELGAFIDQVEGLLAADDVEELTAELPAGRTGLVLAFENLWVRPLLAAVRAADGAVLSQVAVTDTVVQEVANTVPDEEE